MRLPIDHDKLLEKQKTIWTKIEDLKNIELGALPVDDRYIDIKATIRKYSNNIYTTFFCLDVPEDGVEYESFTVIFIDSLLVYKNKYYLQVATVPIKLWTSK